MGEQEIRRTIVSHRLLLSSLLGPYGSSRTVPSPRRTRKSFHGKTLLFSRHRLSICSRVLSKHTTCHMHAQLEGLGPHTTSTPWTGFILYTGRRHSFRMAEGTPIAAVSLAQFHNDVFYFIPGNRIGGKSGASVWRELRWEGRDERGSFRLFG